MLVAWGVALLRIALRHASVEATLGKLRLGPIQKALAQQSPAWQTLKPALAYGTLTAGFTIENFSLERRMAEYRKMLSF